MVTVTKVLTEKHSPVAQMTADANRIEYVKDANGRLIGCKKLTFLDSHKITCLLGDDASNVAALNQALVIASVVKIGDDDVRIPVSKAELHALMARLDFPGVSAATEAMAKFAPVGGNQDEATAALKN